jgi:hypothetical protein
LRFTYYSDKTAAQCVSALNERLRAKRSLEGRVEKNGRFVLTTTCRVMRRFKRATRLEGIIERESGVTVIKGSVPDGVNPKQRVIIFGALLLAGIFIILSGSLLPGLIILLLPPALNIPLAGDYRNSRVLIGEVQRTLKAKRTPPVVSKKPPTAARTGPTSSARR